MSDISLSKAVRTNLLSLQNTATMMEKTQQRLATGNKVNSALDNPSNFFTASALNSRAADMGNLLDSMASGIKVIEAANNGLTALTKNLESMQSTLRQARQDKSFQTKSFDIGAESVIKLSGGALGNGVSEISLAEATKPGKQAQLTTIGAEAFRGIQSKADVSAGAGARSVINFAEGSLAAGDKFTVAGVEVEVAETDAAPDANSKITAEDLVANIQSALTGSDVEGQYVVSLGEGDLAGKVIIESVDTSANAAEVVFAETEAATHGTTTFNYSAVNSSITVGDQQIETGTDYDQFVANLRAKEKAGGYEVSTNAETKQITLTSVKPGTAAPDVEGVQAYRAAAPASKTEVSFTLAASAEQGSFAKTTFTLANSGSGLTHDQELTIDGFTDKVVLEASFSTTAVGNAIRDVVGDDYDVDVGTNFEVTLTAKAVGTTRPDVTSNQVVAGETTASMVGVGGVDMSGETAANALAGYAGTTITITDGTNSTSHEILATDNITSLLSALNDNSPASHPFTVTAGDNGLDVASSLTANFTVTITNDGTDFGIGPSSKTSDNGKAAQTAGITVAADGNDGDPAGQTLLNDEQKLTIGNTEVTLTKGMTAAQVQNAIRTQGNNAIGNAYDVSVDADFKVTLTDKTTGVTTAPNVSSNQVAVSKVEASHTLSTQFDFDTDDDLSSLAGTTITLTSLADPAVTVDYDFTAATSGQRTALLDALAENGFTVDADDGDLTFSREDGQNFTINLSTGPNNDMGMPNSTITTDNGVVAQANGIVGGNTTGVSKNAGEAAITEIKGEQSVNGTPGAYTDTIEAARDKLSIAYGDKIAHVTIAGVKGGVGADANTIETKNWQDATVASVNQQLKDQGISGLEAKFDDKNQLTFVATKAEAKTLSITGDSGRTLFGDNALAIGEPERSELSATKPVDKFVELINRDYGGLVRASNDNGKLRIENLSTQKLDVGVAANKDADAATQMIEGNGVRANLSKQFNELRDQFDKLADDASFNGINLLRGDKLTITFNESGSSSIAIQSKDKNDNARAITAANMGVEFLDAVDLDSDEGIDAFLGKISAALSDLRSQASTFGSNLSSVQNRQDFTKNMIGTLQAGAANLTLADMNEEAANLLALQTRQSLSSSALSMASQQDQSVLQLLR